jgi:hypothetical protein
MRRQFLITIWNFGGIRTIRRLGIHGWARDFLLFDT